MKVKKDDSKNKKKKNKIPPVANSGINKPKRTKKVKIENNTEVGEAIKKELTELVENQSSTSTKMPLRQERWNSYLKVFFEHEKLNKKQKQLIEFCTNKGLTPPRRKAKFLRFVRSCYSNQADVTDEQISELFDTILLKYVDFKSGKYHSDPSSSTSDSIKAPPKLSYNKKKKMRRAAEAKTNSPRTKVKKEKDDEEKWTNVKSKKRKPKVSVKVENNIKMETDN